MIRELKPNMSEDEEQQLVVEWLEARKFKFTAIPNSTYTTSWKQKAKNKRTGVRAGFPDLVVIVPCQDKKTRLVAIELKKAKKVLKSGKLSTSGTVVSEFQKSWIEALNECDNVGAYVCYGHKEAISLVKHIENITS